MRKKPSLENHKELQGLVDELHRMESGEELREKTIEAGQKVESQRAQAAGEVPRLWVVGGMIALVVIILAGMLWWWRSTRNVNTIAVPAVINTDLRSAQAKITNLGLRVRVNFDAASAAASGKVINQQPAAGTLVPPGGDVLLTVAGRATPVAPPPIDTPATSDMVSVPEVEGLVDTRARSRLEELGLRVEIIAVRDPAQREFMVLASDPPARTTLKKGDTVKLSVNMFTPSRDANFVLLDYSGKSAQAAVEELRGKGLTVATRGEASRNFSAGRVIRTEPPANSSIAPGSTVTVVIAR